MPSSTPDPVDPSVSVRPSRSDPVLRFAATAWLALLLLQPLWYLWLAPPSQPALAAALGLLFLLLPALAYGSGLRRALLWAGIVSLFYFCHGVVAAWVAPPARLPALLEVLLCLLLIGALGVDARRGRRRAG